MNLRHFKFDVYGIIKNEVDNSFEKINNSDEFWYFKLKVGIDFRKKEEFLKTRNSTRFFSKKLRLIMFLKHFVYTIMISLIETPYILQRIFQQVSLWSKLIIKTLNYTKDCKLKALNFEFFSLETLP